MQNEIIMISHLATSIREMWTCHSALASRVVEMACLE